MDASAADARPPDGVRLLFISMYDPGVEASAPRVRIRLLGDALARHPRVRSVDRIEGGSRRRLSADLAWLTPRRLRSIDAIYVEAPTSPAMPWDLALLAMARAARVPTGVYFRDAYQKFRSLYPRTSPRQRISDPLWRVTTPLVGRLATVRFVPSAGLGRLLGFADAKLLPPGTDPSVPDLGAGDQLLVAYVGGLGVEDGFDLLLDAMSTARESCPEARLRVISKGAAPADLPPWVELVRAGRSDLADLLAPARLCVIPRPINDYADLAVPVKLMDYLSFGKPVVTTAATETASIVRATGGGLVADEPTAAGLARSIVALLRDRDLAAEHARHARDAATNARWTWDGCAATIIEALAPTGTGRA